MIYNPHVGIFWYDPVRGELCGVYKQPEEELSERHDGTIMFPVLHQEVWNDLQNYYYDQYGTYLPDDKYPDEENNPFAESDYTKVRRGRVIGTKVGTNVISRYTEKPPGLPGGVYR